MQDKTSWTTFYWFSLLVQFVGLFGRRFKCKHLKQVNYRIIPAYSHNTVQLLHSKDCIGGACVAQVSSVGRAFLPGA